MEQERTLALALCRVEGIGAVSIRKLLEKAGDVSEIRKLPAESLQKLLGRKSGAFEKLGCARKSGTGKATGGASGRKKEFPSIFCGKKRIQNG